METSGKLNPEEASKRSVAGSQPLGTIRDYDLTAKIGEGGMGTVYLGVHRIMRREVAITLM